MRPDAKQAGPLEPPERRPAEAVLFSERAEKREEAEDAEDEQRPGANRHRRVGLEHRGERVVLDQHVPEAKRPRQIESQQKAADQHGRERDVVAEPRETAILRSAEEVEQRREEVAASREPANEEIEHDVPLPMRIGREPRARGRIDHGRVSS
jgi:hypothetical protein